MAALKRTSSSAGPAAKRRPRKEKNPYGRAQYERVFAPNRGLPIQSGLPRTKKVRMRYSTNLTVNSDTDSVCDLALFGYRFRANSIYDPDSTGVGHQPMGHDQWHHFYESYRVENAWIEVEFMKGSGSLTKPLDVGVYLDLDGTTYTQAQDIYESGAGDIKRLIVGAPSGTNDFDRTVRMRYDRKLIFPEGGAVDLSKLNAGFDANPTHTADFVVFVQNMIAAAGNAGAKTLMKINICYDVILDTPRDLPQS